jgi:hypothetical protein
MSGIINDFPSRVVLPFNGNYTVLSATRAAKPGLWIVLAQAEGEHNPSVTHFGIFLYDFEHEDCIKSRYLNAANSVVLERVKQEAFETYFQKCIEQYTECDDYDINLLPAK